MIKGFYKKPKKEELTGKDLAASMLGTTQLFNQLQTVKEDIISTLDSKVNEVDSIIKEAESTVAESKTLLENKLSEFESSAVSMLQDIQKIPHIQGLPGKDAEPVDTKAIIKEVLNAVPKPEKIDETKLLQNFLKQIPENKASLKIIRETFETDPSKVVDHILSLPVEKFQLKMDNISGLRQELASYRNQMANGKGYIHGGGFNNIYSSGTLVSNGLTGLNFSGSGVSSVTKDNSTGIITVNISGGGGTPGGADTSIQFNNGGSFGGFGTYDGSIMDIGGASLTLGGGNINLNGGLMNVAEGSAVVFGDNPFTTQWASIDSNLIDTLRLGNSNGVNAILDLSSLNADRTFTFPDQSGTIALLSDITGATPRAETPSGTVDSVNVTFTLASTPIADASVIVVLDGLVQYNGTDFTMSGATITFSTAPVTGSSIFAYYSS